MFYTMISRGHFTNPNPNTYFSNGMLAYVLFTYLRILFFVGWGGIISQWSVSSDTRIGRSNTQSGGQISRVQSCQIGSTYLLTYIVTFEGNSK